MLCCLTSSFPCIYNIYITCSIHLLSAFLVYSQYFLCCFTLCLFCVQYLLYYVTFYLPCILSVAMLSSVFLVYIQYLLFYFTFCFPCYFDDLHEIYHGYLSRGKTRKSENILLELLRVGVCICKCNDDGSKEYGRQHK